MLKFSYIMVSFLPLWIIFLIKFGISYPPNTITIFFYAGAIIIIGYFCYNVKRSISIASKKRRAPDIHIEKIQDKSTDNTFYASSYILPFIIPNFKDPIDIITIFVMLGIILILFMRLNLYSVNIVLVLLNYKTYKVVTNRREIILVSKSYLTENDHVKSYDLDSNFSLGVYENDKD